MQAIHLILAANLSEQPGPPLYNAKYDDLFAGYEQAEKLKTQKKTRLARVK